MKKNNLILIGFAVLLIGSAYWYNKTKNSYPGAKLPPAVVILNEDGFSPQEITIIRGQSVTFKTTRGKQFWPASDLHPSHTIYPEFDPLEPIQPDKSWTFRFDKIGSWKLHDHLAPSYRGVINVVLSNDAGAKQVAINDCSSIKDNQSKSLECWDEFMRNAVRTKGIAYSLRLLSSYYDQPMFSANCHIFTHTIGEAAYVEFMKNNKIDISPEMNYCGFGFYHGFMEALFQKGGSIQTARDLCAYMDKQTGNNYKSTNGACFHGIGHGVVDGSNKKDWGNAQALINPGLKLCGEVAVTEEEHYRCYSGVFNSLSIAYSSGQYDLKTDPIDPLKICREQQEQYKKACYSDMAVAVSRLVSDDLLKGSKFAEKIAEDKYANEEMKNLAGLKVRASILEEGFNFKAIADVCNSIQDRLRAPCIIGFGVGLIEFGNPITGYTKSFEFCGYKDFSEENKRACYKDSINLIRVTVTAEEFKSICTKIDVKYSDLCQLNRN